MNQMFVIITRTLFLCFDDAKVRTIFLIASDMFNLL